MMSAGGQVAVGRRACSKAALVRLLKRVSSCSAAWYSASRSRATCPSLRALRAAGTATSV